LAVTKRISPLAKSMLLQRNAARSPSPLAGVEPEPDQALPLGISNREDGLDFGQGEASQGSDNAGLPTWGLPYISDAKRDSTRHGLPSDKKLDYPWRIPVAACKAKENTTYAFF
jgi:hypothetical protein